jgi:glycosyltransferase involved in cell wall biosynthesis
MTNYSVIIPLYNRPSEIKDLLTSLVQQSLGDFEVIIVEDGSEIESKHVVKEFEEQLRVRYLFQENTGPALARNYGADHAQGEFLIFFDSDCIIPEHYFRELDEVISGSAIDAFGGPDSASEHSSYIQKAINYSMTSFFTTGGIRGGDKSMEKFKPRSFNMGVKKNVYEAVRGFRDLRFGEDIDLSLRLEQEGFNIKLIPSAWVYHQRRTNFRQFFKQTFNSGMARIVLNQLFPGSMKMVHYLPFVFVIAHVFIILFGTLYVSDAWLLVLPFPLAVMADSAIKNRSLVVGFYSVIASYVQLFGYGLGWLKAAFIRYILRKPVEYAFRSNFYE